MTLGFGRPDAAPVDTDVLLEWAISPNGPAFGIELAVVGVAGEPEVGVNVAPGYHSRCLRNGTQF